MKDFLWVEKYAPKRVQDCILPRNVKSIMTGIVDQQDMQNMLFHSTPGTGKTTCAVALCHQIGADFIVINGSDEGRFLDTARSRVKTFASSISMTSPDRPKVVIYDEFDNTPKDVQLLLRGAINDFQDNCRFIFTVNTLGRVLDAIQSRTTLIDFSIPAADRMDVGKAFYERCEEILKKENISYEPQALAKFIMKLIPDFRKLLNEIQKYGSATGSVDTGIIDIFESSYDALYEAIKSRSFKDARTWLVENNAGVEFYSEFNKYLMDNAPSNIIPFMILIMAKYQHMGITAFDLELNASACILELIKACNVGSDESN